MSRQPICFGCKYFKQYPPLHFRIPGECGWEPHETVPEWLQGLGITDRYYGPHREVSTADPILICQAFEEMPGG